MPRSRRFKVGPKVSAKDKLGSGYPNFTKYAVTDVRTVKAFLDKYYKPDRYKGRGEEYARGLLASYEAEYRKYGYTFISHHDSKTGEVVAFYARS